jgi:hypothetical protein
LATTYPLALSSLLLSPLVVSAQQVGRDGQYFRVFFRDKGTDVWRDTVLGGRLKVGSPTFEATRALHTPKAIARRLKVAGSETALFSLQDAPIAPAYLDSVQRILRTQHGAKILLHLRWHNYVVVDCNAQTAARLEQLSCVRAVQRTSARLFPQRYAAADAAHTVESSESEALSFGSLGSPAFLSLTAPKNTLAQTASSVLHHTSNSPQPIGEFKYWASERQINSINAAPLHAIGITGTNVLMGFVDSGFRWREHEALKNARVLAERDFIMNDTLTTNKPADSTGQDEHGTLVLSSVAAFANGSMVGVAPRASFLLAKTENLWYERHIEEDNFAAAMEWFESQGVDVVNASLGYLSFDPPDESYSLNEVNGATAISTRAVNDAVRRGVVHCNAAGNSGPGGRSLNIPADADLGIAVAATRADSVMLAARFSSRGPRIDGGLKPDVAAQGESVIVANHFTPASYRVVSGTSFSSPLVAGGIALMLSAFPELTPAQIRSLLSATASQANRPDSLVGFGTANIAQAMARYGLVITPEVSSYPVYRAQRVAATMLTTQSSVRCSLFVRFATSNGAVGSTGSAQVFPMQVASSRTANGMTTFTLFADIHEALFGGKAAEAYLVADDGREPRRVPFAGTGVLHAATAPTLRIVPSQSSIPAGIALNSLPFSLPTPDYVEGIRPSPVSRAQGAATLMSFNAVEAPLTLSVYSSLGHLVHTQTTDVGIGLSNIAFPVSQLAQGVYYVVADCNGTRRVFPLTVAE